MLGQAHPEGYMKRWREEERQYALEYYSNSMNPTHAVLFYESYEEAVLAYKLLVAAGHIRPSDSFLFKRIGDDCWMIYLENLVDLSVEDGTYRVDISKYGKYGLNMIWTGRPDWEPEDEEDQDEEEA